MTGGAERRGALAATDDRFRDHLHALAPDAMRPLWSVMIPTYNCAGYLRETLRSVLAQDQGRTNMQIEVVDDASTADDPEVVVAEIGKGRVGFYRRPQNGGHTANFRTCLERAQGKLIHLLHGDDAVGDGFYRKLQHGFDQSPAIGAAFCRQIYIDENGNQIWISDIEREESGVLENWLERIAIRQRIQTPSIAVRRDVYETLGLFDRRLTWVEDWEMWVRIAAHYPVWYEPEPLAYYRMHGTSNTSRYLRTGENLRDLRRGISIIQGYLPPARAEVVRREALEHCAHDALTVRLPQFLSTGDVGGAVAQWREALNCSWSPRTLGKALRVVPGIARVVARNLGRSSAAPSKLR